MLFSSLFSRLFKKVKRYTGCRPYDSYVENSGSPTQEVHLKVHAPMAMCPVVISD